MGITVVVNPVSGAGGRPDAGPRRAALARAVLAAEGAAGEVRVSERAGHAFELAQAAVAGGAELVVAWGGDGTVNEVARAVAFGPAALGIVPAGSGNGLARDLGLPTAPPAALRAALRSPVRTIDAGELGGHLFFNTAGIGLDAQVAARFNARSRGRRGLLPYLGLLAATLLRYRAEEYELRIDGERLAGPALMVACCNSRQYGAHALIAPRARLDDGRLDLVVIAPRPALRALWQTRRLFTGTIDTVAGVRSRPFTRLEVRAAAPLLFHVDGEPVRGGAVLSARALPGALRVRAAAARDRA